jgi:site-specific DNA recombinase
MATSDVAERERVRRALIYTRVSKDKRQGRSVDEQEDECRRVCDLEGWRIADVLSDNDCSASRYATRNRPAWEQVKHRIATDVIDVLVTWEASRSSRDLAGFVELRDLCQEHGVRLNYKGRTLDLDVTNDRFEAGLHAILAERESDETRDRILRAVRSQAAAGRPHGRVLYGYKRTYDPQTGALVGQEPDPETSEIVREIARRFLSGESIYSITDDLNARGVSDKPWNANRVKRCLTNPGYAGFRVYRGEIDGDADWEPIIDRATFDAIAARFAPRRGGRGGQDVKYLLSGIARCGKCGGDMYVNYDRRKGARTGIYSCLPGKGHVARNQAHLDAYITAIILERLATVDFADFAAEHSEATQARAEAAELRERLDAAAGEYSAGNVSASMLGKVEAELVPRIKAAEKRARAAAIPPNIVDLAGEGVDERWDALNVEQRREVVRLLLDVTVLPSTRPRGATGFDPDAVRLEWPT